MHQSVISVFDSETLFIVIMAFLVYILCQAYLEDTLLVP